MKKSTLEDCQDLIDYRFNDLAILKLGLTHSSAAPTRQDSNERMEFLGDSVLGLVVCENLYENNAGLMEGEMTKIKSHVVSRQTCAEIATSLGIEKLLFTGKGIMNSRTIPMSVAAATLEAIIGAIFLDGGFEPARKFILTHLQPKIDEALEDEFENNFKSMMQQFAQRKWSSTPDYQLLDEKGPDHSKCFEVAVVVRHRHFTSAWGTTKKEAEQKAAKSALTELGIIKEE